MDPKHILGLGDLTATVVAILAISAMPAYAQNQQPDIAKLKANAQNAFTSLAATA